MSQPAQEDQMAGQNGERRETIGMSSIFDFANYVRLFKRNYSATSEVSNRMKLFLARAFRVFVSAVKFKYSEQHYYFAINKFSDATPEELDMMRNRAFEKEPRVGSAQAGQTHSKEFDDDEASLREILRKYPDELRKFSAGIVGESPRHRVQGIRFPRLRELDMNKLINVGQNAQPQFDAQEPTVSSSNSYHSYQGGFVQAGTDPIGEPDRIMFGPGNTRMLTRPPPSRGLKSGHVGIKLGSYWVPPIPSYLDAYSRLVRVNRDLGLQVIHPSPRDMYGNEQQLPDEVFSDLRQTTRCFVPPRDQGQCGACYAYATTTIAEWLFCMKTGTLVAFSEQYMIDCGKDHVPGVRGCNGGDVPGAAEFFDNFGVEPLDRYWMTGWQGQCRYHDSTPLYGTGFYRMLIRTVLNVPMRKMPQVIKMMPICVGVEGTNSIIEYGGGVLSNTCHSASKTKHLAVLVGHGRENGREYWLIRNSWGTNWGEGGYFKLDKRSRGLCDSFGYAFASTNGRDTNLPLSINQYNQFGLNKLTLGNLPYWVENLNLNHVLPNIVLYGNSFYYPSPWGPRAGLYEWNPQLDTY